MDCQVKRNKTEVTEVLASNNEKSLAYQSLLDIVNRTPDKSSLQEKYGPWVGKYIQNINDPKELALALYKQLYSPNFKDFYGDWTLISSAISKLDDIKGSDIYKDVFRDNPQDTMFEIAKQANSSESEKEGATVTFGPEIVKLSTSLFPNIQNGDPYLAKVGELDKNGEPLITNDIFTNARGDQRNVLNQPLANQYQQAASSVTTIPPKASRETIAKIKEFLNRMGVKLETVSDIVVNGKKIGANGIADPMNRLVQVIDGKEDTVLPEEAMHIATALIEINDPTLFKQLMNRIQEYPMYNQVFQDYQNIYKTTDNKPDIAKIKKEAIAKVLTNIIIDKDNTNTNPTLIARVQDWWRAIVNSLKAIFLKTNMNPFEKATEIVDKKDVHFEVAKDGTFLQVNITDNLSDRLNRTNKETVKVNGKYEVNGKSVRHTIEEEVFKQSKNPIYRGAEGKSNFNRNKQELEITEDKIKADISNIFNRLVNSNGELRETELDRTGVSEVSPLDDSFYLTMKDNLKERMNEYPEGTKFFNNLNIYDSATQTAGTVDFLAVKPDNKIDIIQFKTPYISPKTGETNRFSQEDYKSEMNRIRDVLEKGYGIKRTDFELTRVIPIRANFEQQIISNPDNQSGTMVNVLKSLSIGNVNVDLIIDDSLIPIPTEAELTGDKRFDAFISKLYALLKKTIDSKVPSSQKEERRVTIANLYKGIKRLQVQKNATSVLNAGKTIINRQNERFTQLSQQALNIDPSQASDIELSNIGNNILEQYDEVSIYSEIADAFDNIFNSDSETDKKIMEQAHNLQTSSKRIADKLDNLAIKFRTQKITAKTGIEDSFTPEKQLTWYRRMVRSLSQSSSNAGRMLWKLVSNINNKYRIEFGQKLKEIGKLEEGLNQWMKGKTKDNLLHTIFQFNSKNEWNGKVVQKYSSDFYKGVREAQEKGDKDWINKNIDMKAYQEWFKQRHIEKLQEVKDNAPYDIDPEQNDKIIKQIMTTFINDFSPSSKFFVNQNNFELRNFPKDDSFSEGYKNLQKPENAPIKAIWERWQKNLEESTESGMLEDNQGMGFFPNVRRGWLDKLTVSGGEGKFKSFLMGDIRIEAEDQDFGMIDPITKRSINKIHANFVTDLGQVVQDSNGNYFKSFGEKSMDLLKVMALWEREMVRYDLKTESEGIARLLAFTEKNRTSLRTKNNGKIVIDKSTGLPLEDDNNDKNYNYLQDHLEAVYYSKNVSHDSDISFSVPIKTIAERINKIAGREIMKVPEDDEMSISGTKVIGVLNRFFVAKTLGLNVLSSLSNLFGGTTNSYINQGKFFNKKDLSLAELQFVSGKFWGDENSKKLAGFLAYIEPYLEDRSMEHVRHLSLSNSVKYFSSDHLFIGQRGSDIWVNQVIAIAFINNSMVRDGKIQNMREVARKELGHDKKYQGDYKDTVAFEKALEARVEELKKSPESLLNALQIDKSKDSISLPGISLQVDKANNKGIDQTVLDFRAQMMEFIKDALGNTSREDLSLYKRSILGQSFAMFKNWIPRMVDVRFQSLKYSAGKDAYEWGRVRMLGNAVRNMGLKSISGLFKSLGGNDSTIIEAGRKAYITQRQKLAAQQEDFNISEAEFLDMYAKGVSSEFKELGLALALFSILIAARAVTPDKDTDPTIKGGYKWALRGIDKLQDEISFFYNPQSASDLLGGSIFAPISLLLDTQRFLGSSISKLFDAYIIGNQQAADKQHPSKYVFRMLPITKELMTYIAIFDQDIAKKYDLRVSSRNGSSR